MTSFAITPISILLAYKKLKVLLGVTVK